MSIERVLADLLADRGAEWFPQLPARPEVRLRRVSDRPRCVLYVAELGAGPVPPRVLAKVRRTPPGAAATEPWGSRPRLASEPLPASRLTELEYAGLRAIHSAFGSADPEFGTVRPLEHLTEHDAILMDYVAAPTVRQALLEQSRLSWKRRPSGDATELVWQRVGGWLRRFQAATSVEGLPVRQGTKDEIAERFCAFQAFLTTRLGARAVGDLGTAGARLAVEVLAQNTPPAVGHGDYAPRNIFVDRGGRITVFDPLTRWAVPEHEDLCRFLVGMRLLGLQVQTHGAAYSRVDVERREQDVIRGYHPDGDIPYRQLRCLQLLVVLDKWSALVDTASRRGLRGRVRSRALELTSHYVRGQARRVLELAESGS